MRYALVGGGRMGRAVDAAAAARGHARVALVDRGGAAPRAERLGGAELAFEFTTAAAAEDNLIALLEAGVRVVCGTTGWEPSPRLERAVERSAAGVVLASNFSIGVQLFSRVVRHAAEQFARAGVYEPFIEEAHHRAKRDAPSGTARSLARLVLLGDPRLDAVVEGNPPGRLPAGALQVSSLRAGHEPGRHAVGFDGPHDVVVLEHRARGREGFALGAVLAAEWLQGRAGLHRFEDRLDEILGAAAGAGAGAAAPPGAGRPAGNGEEGAG